jgi:hypothetical protein
MFEMRLDSMLCDLVENFIDREYPVKWENGTITKKGIIFEILCRVHDFSGKDRKSSYKQFYVMFCGNTNVFYVMKKISVYNPLQIPFDKWINTSNHDSCWRSDGLEFINKMYFDMCNEVNSEKAPVELYSSADIGNIKPKNVLITYKNNEETWKNEVIKVEII